LLIAIGDAMEAARFGTPNDESIALQANKLVRRYLGKQAIKYADYKKWRRKNPLIFTSLVDRDNSLIGFFDVLPLTREAGDGIIAGTLSERSLTIDHLVRLSKTPNATHVHIATILTNPRQRVFPPLVARETFRLSYLTPDIVCAFLEGRQPIALRSTSDDPKTASRDPAAVRPPHPGVWRLWWAPMRSPGR
jgi:hypothetical protein